MTEDLYEHNHLTNDSIGAYRFQNNLAAITPGYGITNRHSVQQSPVSPHVNHNHLSSPATPQNQFSPLLDMPHSGGSWDYSQSEKSSSSLWGSSAKDDLTDPTCSHTVFPFNVVPHSDSAPEFNVSDLQRLDSFSKAFPVKNLKPFGSVGEKSSGDGQLSEILLSPQSGAPDGSDREPFSPMTMQSQLGHYQLTCHPRDTQHMTHSPYPNHQQYHYGYQQHKPQLRESHTEQVNKDTLCKLQSQYHLQQYGIPMHQTQLTPFSPTLQKHEQRGLFIQHTSLDAQDAHGSVGSPNYCYPDNCKAHEQPAFQAGQGLPPPSPHFQESPHVSHQSGIFHLQQPQEQAQSFSLKQNTSFAKNHLSSIDTMPGFSSPKEEVYVGLNYPYRRASLCSSHYQHVGSGVRVSQEASLTTLRGGVHHLNSHRQPAQMPPVSQDDQISSLYRPQTEVVKVQGSSAKLKCLICQREFKSLPALNGHMRSHGGFRTLPSSFKTSDGQVQLSRETAHTEPMVLPVSVPVKEGHKIIPKLHNYLNSQPRLSDLTAQVEPSQKDQSPHTKGATDFLSRREKKRPRHRLTPLVISPCTVGLVPRGPVLFQSLLHSSGCHGDDAPYTPPPMLNPTRPGSGLFSNLKAGHHCSGAPTVARVHLCKDSDVNGGTVTLHPEDKSRGMKPRINIGISFQAEIPDIHSSSKAAEDIHNANLLWKPCHLEMLENQQRVDDLLKMACSSVLPGGGTNTEYTIHCLFECRGDVMVTLERLLSLKPIKCLSSLQTDYHYAGSDKWTLQEKRQLNKALINYNKDFHLIQKMVKTKSVAQCVEYYYTWKERLRLGRRLSTGPVTPSQEKEHDLKEGSNGKAVQEANNQIRGPDIFDLPDDAGAVIVGVVPSAGPMFNGDEWNQSSMGGLQPSSAEHNRHKSAQQFVAGSVKSSPSNSTTSGDTDFFPCTECGKVFFKVKSRNAHMKTHRQQDDPQFWQLHRFPEQEMQTVTPGSPSVIPHLLPRTSHS
ncbi:transcriptional-regulating factor 1 [Brachyhypopomus gauderio]|uniref:transcriptional-regulating factor 1 n=1 Tax=Brachyhypopomus gauderio TaxID=698409 RepID=UPI004042BB1B